MEKFVPGPWKYDSATRLVTADNDKRYIAFAEDDTDEEYAFEEEATAKLIAAAPKMYDLLKNIITYELAPKDIQDEIKLLLKKINS